MLAGQSHTADDELAGNIAIARAKLSAVQPNAIDADGVLVDEALKQVELGKEYLRLYAQQKAAPIQTAAAIEVVLYNHLYDLLRAIL